MSAANEPTASGSVHRPDAVRVLSEFYASVTRHRIITSLSVILGFRSLILLLCAPLFGGPPPYRLLPPFDRSVYLGAWIALIAALWIATAHYLITSVGSGAARGQTKRYLFALKLVGALSFLGYLTYAISVWVKSYAPWETIDQFGWHLFLAIVALAVVLAGAFLLAFFADLLDQRIRIEVKLVRGKAADAG